LENCELKEAALLQLAYEAAAQVDAGAIAQTCDGDVERIKTAIFNARLDAVK